MALDSELIDKSLVDCKRPEQIIGENGLLKQLTKAILWPARMPPLQRG